MAAIQPQPGSIRYEAPDMVAEYLLFHYGNEEDILGNLPGPSGAVGFARRLVKVLLSETGARGKALDIGCAVGGSSFELSSAFDDVLGIDFSHAFIHAARELKNSGQISAIKRIEGHITAPFLAVVPESARRDRVKFEVGDACNLDAALGDFDVVVAANLICRLPDPRIFLSRLPALVRPGGELLLTTPFTWMEEYTPVDAWLGATPESGSSFSVLQSALDHHFSLEYQTEIPFLIREHQRKFQYTIAAGSRWRRK